MTKDKLEETSSKKPANKKQRTEDKEKIKQLLIMKANEIEEAAKLLAPDFDYEAELKIIDEEDSLIDAIEADEEEVKAKIQKILEVYETRIEEAADRIAPNFDYEAAAEELQSEIKSDSHFVWKTFAKEVKPKIAGEDDQEQEYEEDLVGEEVEETEFDSEENEVKEADAEEIEAEEADAEEEEPKQKPLPEALVSPSKYPKAAYAPRTAIGKFFLKDRHREVLAVTLAMLIGIIGWQAYDYLVPKDINIIYHTYGATEEAKYTTKARTVGELKEELSEQDEKIFDDVEVLKTDITNYADEKPVSNNMSLTVLHAKKTKASIAGKEQEFWLVPGTVKDNLAYNNITYDKDDEIKPALHKTVSAKTNIKVDEVHYKVSEKKEKVEAESKVILDPTLTSGVQEKTKGKDGEGIFTYTKKYVNGKKVNTDRKVKKWIKKPQDNTLRLGTSATGDKGTYIVVRTFTANTTAYTAGAGARGALGEVVHVGTCAVDPSFVSYRSNMWIEGYGYAYANDCGGAVKGNVVDLYMSSHSQCVQWGRRNVTAYVLQRVE